MRILVTGAAGFIASHLITKLIENCEVVGIDSLNDYYDVSLKRARLANLQNNLKSHNFKFFHLDMTENNKLADALRGENFTHIIHLAAYAGVRYSIENPYPYVKNNLDGLLNILEIARHSKNFQKFVFASSSSVYGADSTPPFREDSYAAKPLSLYGATKRGGEHMVFSYASLYKIPSVNLRFFTVYGPYGRPDMAYFSFTKNIIEGKKITVYNNGEMRRDFTYVDDIVSGIIAALNYDVPTDSAGVKLKTFNLGNNNPELVSDLVKIIENETGKKAIIDFKPAPPADVEATCADLTLVKKELGFAPKTKLAEGMKNFIEWYRSYYG